ncbi:MAG: hypothetical protein IJN96_01790 [Clostridia bacterium]|nr:hypothetical protein [Clostridia bacterium]
MTDKFELSKDGTMCKDNNHVVKIDENRYVVVSNPYNVVINVSHTSNGEAENKKSLDFLGEYIGEFLHNQIE